MKDVKAKTLNLKAKAPQNQRTTKDKQEKV